MWARFKGRPIPPDWMIGTTSGPVPATEILLRSSGRAASAQPIAVYQGSSAGVGVARPVYTAHANRVVPVSSEQRAVPEAHAVRIVAIRVSGQQAVPEAHAVPVVVGERTQ